MRYVILEHDHPVLHWDLMLEVGLVLKTWRLARAPAMDGTPISAEALPDHRLQYLDYEGPVSGDRGTVKRWDAGTYEEEAATDGARHILLRGIKLVGRLAMTRLESEKWEAVASGLFVGDQCLK